MKSRTSASARPSLDCPRTRAPGSTSCRASPGTSGRTRPASSSPRSPIAPGEVRLVVDVGTNAEIVLGNADRLLAASSPTGPAFEGAQISGGQRAAPGAIERVRIDPATLEPRFRIIGAEPWSDEPGFAEAADELGVTGICGSGIVEVIAELFLAGVITEDGVIDGALGGPHAAGRRGRPDVQLRPERGVNGGPRIVVTQNDVRAIQLAKAALYAGVRLLMDQLGIEAVDEIRLAGRLRQPDRHDPRDDPRAHPRLRPRPRRVGRQRGRDRAR